MVNSGLVKQILDLISNIKMMNKKEILKKVGGILSELNEQFEYLSQSPDNLNKLELELFSANANFLSDHLAILVKLNDTKVENQNISDEEPEVRSDQSDSEIVNPLPERQQVKNIIDWKLEVETTTEPELRFEVQEEQSNKLFDQPLTDDEKRVIDEKTRLKIPVEEDLADSTNVKEADDKNIKDLDIVSLESQEDDIYLKEVMISEQTIDIPVKVNMEDNLAPTVNDLLSRNISHQTVAGQFNLTKAKDLKAMISLNDKLLFVRDLFNGYSLAYSEALELLNRFDSFEAADNFLQQNYAVKNNWADKQDVTDKFYEILNIRFVK
ncbi:hypothetical protein [Daejeonella sp.]|uniref:hypothetical protein n=1 Tax=Daejeonella sp. TaxID=2805397 RepID=UPI003983A6C5